MKFLSNLQAEKTVAVDFTTSTGDSRKLYWDNDNHTLSLEMGNGVIQQIGQEQLSEARNSTISTIPNGTIVMITESVGESGRLTIAPAVCDGSIHSRQIIGITTHDILSGEDGVVTSFGLVRDIPISMKPVGETWVAGERLYTHPTIVGAMTNVEPVAPNLKVIIGQIVFVDETKFSIFVRLNHGSYLGGDNNVQVTNLATNDILFYNDSTSRWENIGILDLDLNAAQSAVSDIGNYYDATDVESVLQEIGAEEVIQNRYLLNQMSTGVTEYGGMVINSGDNTKFDVGPIVGYVVTNEVDPDSPTIVRVEFAGQTGITPPYLLTDEQTTVYLTSIGTLFYTNAVSGTAKQRREMILLGRIIHTDKTIIRAIENWPTVDIAVGSQLRDLWRAIGPINEDVFVYPNGANLQLSLNGGALNYGGLNYVNDRYNPTRLTIPSQTTLTFGYRTRAGTVIPDVTTVTPNYYDNNGVITLITGLYKKSTNQRVFLTRSGSIRIQYGQTVYNSFGEAIAAIPTEPFVVAPSLASNAILIGVITMKNDVTALNATTGVRFTTVSKFGELGGGGGGAGAAVNATDVAVLDSGNYFTSSNAEDVLQEVGYALNHIVDTNTITIVGAGTGIDTTIVESPAQTFTYTVSHEDTSTLSGLYGTEGIQSVTIDGMGHVTGVTTNTYLTSTTQSKDFRTIIVTDNDTGYTWQDTGSLSADMVGDTVTFVSDGGIEVNIDPTADAIQFVNSDKGSSQSIFKNIAVSGQNTVTAETNDDTVTLVAGDYISITTDATTDTITIGTTGISLDWSAIQNKPDPTITLGGDLSGSVTLTDLASGTLNATINANSVTLGTDTTGDYVSTLTQGTGISITGGTGETSTPTIAHGDTSSASNISSANSNGVVIQDISVTLDDYGHITASSIETIDLDGRYYTESEIDTKLNSYQLTYEKGQANGYASLGSDGLVPTAQLPSYVDDVLEFANLDSFPPIGETGKIYVALDTNKTYRWSGSAYIYITSGAVDSVGGYTGVVSASNLLTAIETVDGTGSGLDSDLLDGQHGSYYAISSDLSSHISNDLRHTNYALADGTNSYSATLVPAPTVYTAGMLINFKVANANTGASTLNCNNLGAKSIFKNVSEELEADDIKIGQIVTVIYDGTNFQIVSGSGGSGSGIDLKYQSPQCGDVKITTSLDAVHLWCDGQAVSRTTYSQLFAVIGTTYGVGDGVNTFNLPNFNDGGLFHKHAICFANIKENLQSDYFIPFTDIESLATVKSYFGPTPPAGWLWTQGQAISRVSYAPLFAIVGETYGAGDGVNTFNIPNIGTNYIIKVEHLLNEQFLGDAGNVSAIEASVTNSIIGIFGGYKFEHSQSIAGTSTIISLDKTIYGSAEYTLQVTQNNIREMTKILVTWSDTDIFFTEYGRIGGTTDVVFSAISNGNLIDITATSTSNPATIKGKVNAIDL